VALLLNKRGITRVRPLSGGFHGWRDRGFPLETVTAEAKASAIA
jgi:rhodanese-related sulfurtransferase